MASNVIQLAPSVPVASAAEWVRAAARHIGKVQGLGYADALVQAIDVLAWTEDEIAPFGVEGFDWSTDAAIEAVNEYQLEGD